MRRSSLILHLLFLLPLSTAQFATNAPANPVKVLTRRWLGNVTSENTNDGRDLGFQGQVGDCWINTFGDTFSCEASNPQSGCNVENIFARNSAGASNLDDPTKYWDLAVSDSGSVDNTFVPHILDETIYYPLGITNVMSTGPWNGVIYYLAGNGKNYDCASGTCAFFQGAGVATVSADYGCSISVERPELSMWAFNEVYYGDHGVLHGQDGYLYAYGSLPYAAYSAVGLARVVPSEATNIDAYQYWNGTDFQEERIFNPSTDISVFTAGQGTVYWNEHYQRYLYFTASVYNIFCLSSETPWGPWSTPSDPLFVLSDMPFQYDAIGFQGFYTPAIQPKFSDPEGSYVTLWFTYLVAGIKGDSSDENQIITAVNITFV